MIAVRIYIYIYIYLYADGMNAWKELNMMWI